jgi:hypothetical protein
MTWHSHHDFVSKRFEAECHLASCLSILLKIKGDLSHERESSEQFVWLNRRYDETETQLSRSAMMPSIRADSSQSEGI